MRRILKISAAIAALLLIIAILWLACALLGNPVSAFLAERTAQTYMEERYSHTDFYIQQISYDFKSVGYYAKIASPSSRDSYFTLRFSMDGKLKSDNYETMVLGKHNTYFRLWQSYHAAVQSALQTAKLPYPVEMCGGRLEFYPEAELGESYVPDYALKLEELVLDQQYDLQELGSRAGCISVYLNADTVRPETAADGLLAVREALDQAGIGFFAIDLVLRPAKPEDGAYWDLENSIDLADFRYADITADGLADRVREADAQTKAYYAELDKEKEAQIEAAQKEK